MTTNNMPTTDTAAFDWGDIHLSQVIYVNGVPHATKTAIGEWLEYSESRKQINRLLDRNEHIDRYSVDVKLTSTDGKNYDTKVYHPIGFLLMVMESGQPKAQTMKVAVAEFVWHFAGPQDISLKERNTYIREIERLQDRLVSARDAMIHKQTLMILQHYCRLAGWPMPDIQDLGKDRDQLLLQV